MCLILKFVSNRGKLLEKIDIKTGVENGHTINTKEWLKHQQRSVNINL